jgi:hypothetical protein
MENLAENFGLNFGIFSASCEHNGMVPGYVAGILTKFYVKMSI